MERGLSGRDQRCHSEREASHVSYPDFHVSTCVRDCAHAHRRRLDRARAGRGPRRVRGPGQGRHSRYHHQTGMGTERESRTLRLGGRESLYDGPGIVRRRLEFSDDARLPVPDDQQRRDPEAGGVRQPLVPRDGRRAAELDAIINKDLSDKNERKEALKTFNSLSSGHKIVILTLTRLVEKVEEKTLVLIDEPEAHLHPPLLSAMTRAISELMVKRNGVAIVATHSPVILQEVPKSCVWILNRVLTASKAERPSIETFAESVGILSREVFQLELSQSGFHQLLREARQSAAGYEAALDDLNYELGAEGRAVLRAMYLSDEP